MMRRNKFKGPLTQKQVREWVLHRTWRCRFIEARRMGASGQVARAISKGVLPPANTCKCADCGKPAVCYDHRDYTKPLMVDPVCKSCDGKRGPGQPYISEDSEEYKAILPAFKREFWNKLKRESYQRKKTEKKWAAYRQRRC